MAKTFFQMVDIMNIFGGNLDFLVSIRALPQIPPKMRETNSTMVSEIKLKFDHDSRHKSGQNRSAHTISRRKLPRTLKKYTTL